MAAAAVVAAVVVAVAFGSVVHPVVTPPNADVQAVQVDGTVPVLVPGGVDGVAGAAVASSSVAAEGPSSCSPCAVSLVPGSCSRRGTRRLLRC